MTSNLRPSAVATALLISVVFVSACNPFRTSDKVNGKIITAEMTDAQILRAFEMDIKTADSRVAKGPDGHTTTYTAGEQKVGITRSVVTGVYVYASGPIKGEWTLGGGKK